MIYSKYTNMTTEEILSIAFNDPGTNDLTLELATRLIAAEDELDCFTDGKNLVDVLDQVERRAGDPDRRAVRVEGGRREND